MRKKTWTDDDVEAVARRGAGLGPKVPREATRRIGPFPPREFHLAVGRRVWELTHPDDDEATP